MSWRDPYAASDNSVVSVAKTMVNGDIVFTVSGGPIVIISLSSECMTANDATASTLQWQSAPTVGAAATITGATTTLAAIAAGATIFASFISLATAPIIALAAAGGVQIDSGYLVHVNPGTIKLVMGVGSTTGTWKHFLRYKPLAPGATVS